MVGLVQKTLKDGAGGTFTGYLYDDGTALQPVHQLTAGEAHIGQVGGTTILASANFTTPAGTTAYAAGDLIADSATAGSVTPLNFTVGRINDGTGMVMRARVKTTDTGFASGSVILKLYKDAPTLTNGDNGVWLTTESAFIGQIPVLLDQHFSDAEKGIGSPSTGAAIHFDCSSGTKKIYGLLVAGASATPQGAKAWTVVLEVLAN